MMAAMGNFAVVIVVEYVQWSLGCVTGEPS